MFKLKHSGMNGMALISLALVFIRVGLLDQCLFFCNYTMKVFCFYAKTLNYSIR